VRARGRPWACWVARKQGGGVLEEKVDAASCLPPTHLRSCTPHRAPRCLGGVKEGASTSTSNGHCCCCCCCCCCCPPTHPRTRMEDAQPAPRGVGVSGGQVILRRVKRRRAQGWVGRRAGASAPPKVQSRWHRKEGGAARPSAGGP